MELLSNWQLGSRHNHGGIFDQKADCWRQIHVTTVAGGGGTSLLQLPGAENPSYAIAK